MNGSAGGPEDAGPPVASAPGVLDASRRWLGWRTRIRPLPALTGALGAAGGLLVIIGVIALGADQVGDDGSGTWGAIFCALTILAALVATIVGTEPIRAGAVAATVVAVPAFWIFLLAVDADGDPTTAIEILTLVSWAALYVVRPMKGRGVLLALTITLFWLFVVDQVAEADPYSGFQRSYGSEAVEGDFGFDGEITCTVDERGNEECFRDGEPIDDFGGDVVVEGEQVFDEDEPDRPPGVISMVFGLAYLAAAWALDRRNLAGAATPFLVVGAIALTVGSIAAAADVPWLVGLFVVATGKATVWIAARTGRRGSAWLGLLLVVGGAIAFSADLFSDSATGFGLLTLALGLLTVTGATFVAARPVLGPLLGTEPRTDDEVLEFTETGRVDRPPPLGSSEPPDEPGGAGGTPPGPPPPRRG